MIYKDGIFICECGLRAVLSAAIGWKCPEHGVTGLEKEKRTCEKADSQCL